MIVLWEEKKGITRNRDRERARPPTNLLHLPQAYASAYFRMSMLGVKNLNDLYDITRALPLPR